MIINTVVLFLLLIKQAKPDLYDEDINLVLPASLIYHSPIFEPSLRFIGYIKDCPCRGKPGISAICFGIRCRDFPSGINISVPLFVLKLTTITTIRKDDLYSLNNIEGLEIESNLNLTRIEPGSFRNLSRLRNLTMSSNMNLRNLEVGVFEGLEKLETLCLSKNGFRKVIDITIALLPKHVPQIVLLDLTENMLHEVGPEDFFPMNGSSLCELNMILCQFEYLHPDCLAPLKNLSSLRLGQNLFNRTVLTDLIKRTLDLGIPLDLLNLYESGLRKKSPYSLLEAIGISNITYLNIGGNHFDYIDDAWFPYMPRLLTLDMRNSLITYISSNAFRNLTNLFTLLLTENKLTQVPDGTVLSTLETLDFGRNSLSGYWPTYFSTPDGIFKNMTILKNLQLPYNNIGFVTKYTFVGLKNLIILNLKNTSLAYIEQEAFIHLKELLHLNLMNNPFPLTMLVTAELFNGLAKLHVLLLGGCSIQNLTSEPSIFYYTKNLTYLGLERNGLHTIAPYQLTHLKELKRLQVAENTLTPWDEPILPHSSLILFIGYQNKFTHITPAMLEDWQTLETLLLDGNPFTCDCSLFPVVYWLRYNQMSLKYYDSDDFIARCVSPDVWHRKSIALFLRNLTYGSSECENFFVIHEALFISSAVTLIVLTLVLSILGYIYRWYLRYYLFLFRMSFLKHNLWYARKSKCLNNCNAYEYDAFISYCNEDRDFVMTLVEKMENEEPFLKVCIYERDFQMGSLISDSILHSVAVSKRTLLVISNGFAKSQWCRWETQLAEYHELFFQNDNTDGPDDTLLMIKLENIDKLNMTPTLKYLMKTRIYLQWDPAPEKQYFFWNKLRTILAISKGDLNQEMIK
ncbi:Toll-9 [Carabus blaptoides fortunei]